MKVYINGYIFFIYTLEERLMLKTRYEGVSYKINRRGIKSFYARFKVNNKAYLRKIGDEPDINARVASQMRFDMIDEIKRGVKREAKSFDELFEEYIVLRSPTLNSGWEKQTRNTYNKYLKDVIGALTPGKLDILDVQKIMNKMLDDGKKPSTVKQIKVIVVGIYTHMLPKMENVGRQLSYPKLDNKVYFEISNEDASRLYREIVEFEEIKWRVFFSFLLHGRRRGEIMKLRWEDVHIDEGWFEVRAENSKSKRMIKSPMMPFLVEMLKEYGVKKSGYVVTGRFENMVSKSSVDYAWNKIKYAVGLKKMRLHDLRHMIGYIAINNGFSLEQIAQVLGHTNIATTKRYATMSDTTAETTLKSILETIN